MSEQEDDSEVREAVVRAIIDASRSETSTLDDEDREVILLYGTRKISRDEMMQFFQKKGARIEEQIRRPQ